MKTVSLSVVILMLFANFSYSLAPASVAQEFNKIELALFLQKKDILRDTLDDIKFDIRKNAVKELVEKIKTCDIYPTEENLLNQIDSAARIFAASLETEMEPEIQILKAEALFMLSEKLSCEEKGFVAEAVNALSSIVQVRTHGARMVDDDELRLKSAEKLLSLGQVLHKRYDYRQAIDAYNYAALVENSRIRQIVAQKIFEAGKALYFSKGRDKKQDIDRIVQSFLIRLQYGSLELIESALRDLWDLLPYSQRIIDAIIPFVKHSNSNIMIQAKRTLRKLAVDKDIPVIRQQLVDYPNKIIRERGVEINCVIAERLIAGHASDRPYSINIFTAVHDGLLFGDEEVRIYAGQLIEENKIDSVQIIETLMRMVLDDGSQKVRAQSIKALSTLNDPRSLDTIITAMNKPRLGVTAEAMEALEKTRGTKAMHALAKLAANWRRKPSVRKQALDHIYKFEKMDLDTARELNAALRSKFPSIALTVAVIYRYFANIKAVDSFHLNENGSKDPLGEKNHTEALRIYLREALIKAAIQNRWDGDRGLHVRMCATDSLAFFKKHKSIVSALTYNVARGKNSQLRKKAAEALGKLEAEEAVKALCQVAQEPFKYWYDLRVSIAAVNALGKIKSSQAIPALRKIISQKDTAAVLVDAAQQALLNIIVSELKTAHFGVLITNVPAGPQTSL